jgi:hypothetical protein
MTVGQCLAKQHAAGNATRIILNLAHQLLWPVTTLLRASLHGGGGHAIIRVTMSIWPSCFLKAVAANWRIILIVDWTTVSVALQML